jgi:hypothetical protein
MKRCPQCDFIYEDDERRCDLDGTELVHDPRPLPGSSSPTVRAAERRASRTFTIIAGSGVVLGLSLLFLFEAITSPSGANNNNQPSSTITAPQSGPTVAPQPTASATPSPNSPVTETPASDNRDDRAARVAKLSAPPTRAPASRQEDTRAPVSSRQEERKPAQSSSDPKAKITSVIKKTGQIITRPFKH